MIEWFGKNRKVAIILTVLIAIEIFSFSSIPGSAINIEGGDWISICYHFIVFFLLSFFLFASLKGAKKIDEFHIIITLLISSIYAITDEIHQIFTPLRTCTFGDLMVDLAGISLAIILQISLSKKD